VDNRNFGHRMTQGMSRFEVQRPVIGLVVSQQSRLPRTNEPIADSLHHEMDHLDGSLS
ncbi:hypothetical protein HAX54_044928, partial [Datura stramonium]|nr:hypothetical protein [Datura stramonium]